MPTKPLPEPPQPQPEAEPAPEPPVKVVGVDGLKPGQTAPDSTTSASDSVLRFPCPSNVLSDTRAVRHCIPH